MKKRFSLPEILWNAWCIVSVIGIWPRFIEPNLVQTKKIRLKLDNLPPALEGLRIVQFSDLHLNTHVYDCFLKKLSNRINGLKPDLIVFTGDFLCFAKVEQEERLKRFLCSLKAAYGCYAILGNHDYNQFVSINSDGEYDVKQPGSSTIISGFRLLFKKTKLKKKITPAAQAVEPNQKLLDLLKETPFKVLHNRNELLDICGAKLNICGLGEYTAGKCNPEQAFHGYDQKAPGIILSHNPDSISLLQNHPGDIILSGHTHGGQINLPFIWKKFTLMENMNLIHGLVLSGKKWIYINQGVGSVMQFRWFAMPEIVLLTLGKNS